MNELEQTVAAYLDGELTPEETRRFERSLAQPEVARVLAEELALRELLRELPDDDTPEHLAGEIEQALGVSETRGWRSYLPSLPKRSPDAETEMASGELAMAGAGELNPGLSGLATIRYALGPLHDAEIKLPEARLPRPTLRQGIDAVGKIGGAVKTVGRAQKTVSRLARLWRGRK